MQKAQPGAIARYLFYGVWAVLMTALTYILGAVSLKMLRRKFGRAGYWALTMLMSGALYAAGFQILGVAFFSLVVLIGVFSELEEMGFTLMVSAFFTLVINSLLAGGSLAIWVYSTGPKWTQVVMNHLETLFKPLMEMNPQVQIKYFDMMLVLPSVVLIMWMGALYLAIQLESRLITEGPQSPDESQSMRRQLNQLRLPDGVVWIFIASLLLAFGGFGNETVQMIGTNVLNVSVVLFFFQGLAVVNRFFESVRMSVIWQSVFMVLIVIYLFLFVSVIGLADYWFDFRSRLAKRTEEFNRMDET